MPTASPTPSPPSTPNTTFPVADRVSAVTTLDSPATEPTDRSIWAAPMTNVPATAITAMIAVWRTMFSRFAPLRKPSSPRVNAKAANTTTNPM